MKRVAQLLHKRTLLVLIHSVYSAWSDRNRMQYVSILSFLLVFSVIGTHTLLSSHAASSTISSQLENGVIGSCAGKITDAGASAGGAVKFGTCSSGGGLDETGNTIPDTNYAIPGGAIFMATNGNDNNAGTQSAPVATLKKAIALVPSGGTIVVRGGTYRDGASSTPKKFTLQAYPHEKPWFDGTNVVTNWTSAGNGQYSVSWSTPSFCNGNYYSVAFSAQSATGPCMYYDETGDSSNPMAVDPQLVFLDGTYVHEVSSQAAATGNNFYYDWSNKVLYIGFNPSGHTVEVAARASALPIQGSGGNIIRGIGFQKYASQEYEGTVTEAAVLANGPGISFENDVFRLNAGSGLGIANSTGVVVNSSVFASNGADGLIANGHESTGGATDGLVIENNIFNNNNTEHFGTSCSYSCMAAGVKLAHMDGFTNKNNLYENGEANAHGFWCDEACTNGIMTGNVARNNGGDGLFYEISSTGVIASNLIYGNGSYGIKSGSATTEIYNNTIVNNGAAALIYDDSRNADYLEGTQVGPNTVSVNFFNNIMANNRGTFVQSWRGNPSYGSGNTSPDIFYDGYDYNSYYRSGSSPNIAEWRTATENNYASVSSFNSAHSPWEAHGRDITDGSNPFTDLSSNDYTLKTSSADYHSGKNLSQSVANALGLSTSTVVSRGAITWYPNGN